MWEGTIADVPVSIGNSSRSSASSGTRPRPTSTSTPPSIPNCRWPRRTSSTLCWQKLLRSRPPHISGKTVVCGHTAQPEGVPLNLGHLVCIDTWVYGAGWLTCLEAETGHYWQANQQGQTREDVLKVPRQSDRAE